VLNETSPNWDTGEVRNPAVQSSSLAAVTRRSVLQLIVIGAVAGALATVVALALPWLPNVASKEGERIDFVFWFVTWICIAVFAVVAAVLGTALLSFRVPLDDEEDGPPIHGHTKLEIWWTAIPAVLVTAISIVSAVVLADNSKATANAMDVKVYAQQFAWTFQYPSFKDVSLPDLYLVKGQSVKLTLRSRDVIHSFWVPQFRQKQDLLPDQDTKLVITPTHAGEFPVICTELCGLGHAVMRTRAIVFDTQAEMNTFMAKASKPQTPQSADAVALFKSGDLGCANCHTLQAAQSSGTLGPDLDYLAAYAKRAGKPIQDFARESILDPAAYIEPGCTDAMPHNFKDLLQPAQLDALVAYLVKNGAKTTAHKGCG
jgi:cytochrome c oxidase subunit 2